MSLKRRSLYPKLLDRKKEKFDFKKDDNQVASWISSRNVENIFRHPYNLVSKVIHGIPNPKSEYSSCLMSKSILAAPKSLALPKIEMLSLMLLKTTHVWIQCNGGYASPRSLWKITSLQGGTFKCNSPNSVHLYVNIPILRIKHDGHA